MTAKHSPATSLPWAEFRDAKIQDAVQVLHRAEARRGEERHARTEERACVWPEGPVTYKIDSKGHVEYQLAWDMEPNRRK